MRVAVLGFGKSGQSLFDELVQNDFVESISIFDPYSIPRNHELSTQMKEVNFHKYFFSFNKNFDLVVISTPDHLHNDDLVKCINLGIPTFVEKPFVTSKVDLENLKLAVSRNPSYQTTCNLILRTTPLFLAAKDEFSKGNFGAHVFIEGKYLYGRWNKLLGGWRGNSQYSVILGGLIHLIDLSCFITGNFDYTASIRTQRITSKEPTRIVDFAQVSMSSNRSGFCSLTTNFSANVPHRRDFSIFGDVARLEVIGEMVDFSSELSDRLSGLSPGPVSKGALLSEFVTYLMGAHSTRHNFPNTEEIFKVLDMCFDKLPDNIVGK